MAGGPIKKKTFFMFQSLMIFLFGVSKAPQYKIIGKIDEDIMFFPDKLMALYEQGIIDSTPVSLYGLVIPAGRDIFRDKTNRW